MPGIATKDDLTPEQQASLRKVQERFASADRLHQQLASRWNAWYGLSRNWRRLQSAHAQASSPRDKDVVVDLAKRQFGQELFIPYCFTVIETNVPRILSVAPRYRALPTKLGELEEAARRPLEKLYERDAAAMSYERKLQETVRSGLRYGLGVQKDYWEKKTRDGKKIVPRALGLGRKVEDTRIVVFEGPQVESVDIFDFFWDPAAKDLDSAGYVIHRTWRDMDYIKERVDEGRKNRAEGPQQGWAELDLEKVKGLSSANKRGETWDGRMQAAGLSNYQTQGNEEFEVWEYHDRDQVITVLGRELVVQEDTNPFLHGDYPFDIYRPTLVEQEFCGIGEVEPIAHLQWELNTLRGQRRDAATLALNRGYFYQVGTLDPAQIVTGAGVFNPVFGNPSEIIQPMPFTDIPQSGVSEEAAIKGDIELTSAMSEAVVGSGGEETATGTQLVQAAANFRIKQKTKNLHVDLLVPEVKKRKALYEQHVVAADQTQSVPVEDSTTPTGYAFLEVTPEMHAAAIEIVPVDGSTEADDPAQKKHDAAELAQSLAPFAERINIEPLIKYICEQHDIEDPGSWIKPAPQGPDGGQIVQQIGQAMHDAGMEPERIHEILEAAYKATEVAQPEEPGQAPKPETPAPENGTPPEPEPARS